MIFSLKQRLGQQAEKMACQFLQKKGFRLLQMNYRCLFGEIDIIMLDEGDIVFVEVRSRSRTDFGTALESINYTKMKKLIKTATYYLQSKAWLHKIHSRFDVITIQNNGNEKQLEWIKSAFTTETV